MDDPGLLILVVGPSGAGKDTLLDAARDILAGDPAFYFPRRDITRPSDAGGEVHNSVDWSMFKARRAAGEYALAWEAHGLGYGVPATIAAARGARRRVIVNVSRSVIDEARAQYAPVRVVNVTAPTAVLAARLAARGRETPPDVAARLARAGDAPVSGNDVVTVVNDAGIPEGVERFLAALRLP